MSAQAVRDMERIIRAAGVTASIYRPSASTAGFFGTVPGARAQVASIPVKPQQLNPKSLAEIGADAAVLALPSADIRDDDVVTMSGIEYTATTVTPKLHESDRTHYEVYLVHDNREAADE